MKKIALISVVSIFLASCYITPPPVTPVKKTPPPVKKTEQPNNTNKSDNQKSSGN